MCSLRSLQERFVSALFNPSSTDVRLPLRANGLDGERRLRIYRNNVSASLTEALRACYPVVERLVGEECFASMAARYIRSHPSTSGDLREFGGEFPEFLEDFPTTQALVYLPDVARLEWARQEIYHAPEAQAIDLVGLKHVPPDRYEDLRFRLHPASRLLVSPYPVLRIWQVNQPDYRGEGRVDLAEGGMHLLIIRRDLEIAMEPLGLGEYLLLSLLGEGHTLTHVCEQAMNAAPEFDLTDTLRRHLARKTLAGFSL
jgi:hypothetical protein